MLMFTVTMYIQLIITQCIRCIAISPQRHIIRFRALQSSLLKLISKVDKKSIKKARVNAFSVINGTLRWINCLCGRPTGGEGVPGRVTPSVKLMLRSCRGGKQGKAVLIPILIVV